jgi:hypothetical protein
MLMEITKSDIFPNTVSNQMTTIIGGESTLAELLHEK